MKIAFDISPLQYSGTGVARYTRELILNLLRLDQSNSYTLVFNSFGNKIDSDFLLTIKQFSNLTIKQFSFPEKLLHFLWNNLHIFPLEWFIGRHDVFYYSDWYTPPFSGKKITTVHDLVFKKYPETVDPYILKTQEERFNFLEKNNVTIIADSNSTKKDIIEHYPNLSEEITVVYPGVMTARQTEEFCKQVLQKFNIAKPYVLSVGKNEPRKNMQNLVKAFASLNSTTHELVIVGPQGWGNQVTSIGRVSDPELFALYQKAKAFVMPSLYEGFGFPLLEAMSLGCLTACSNSSSLLEIAGGASLLFDPLDENDITKTLDKIIFHKEDYTGLIQKGIERAKEFQWNKTASKIISVVGAGSSRPN